MRSGLALVLAGLLAAGCGPGSGDDDDDTAEFDAGNPADGGGGPIDAGPDAAGPECGDGVTEAPEVCDDGTDNGTISTTDSYCAPDCSGTQLCGNDTREGSEECDGEANCVDCISVADADGDGISDVDEGVGAGTDTDGDGTPDYLDTDSDDDGIPDSVEAGDSDITTDPVDSDLDTVPDYRDTDSDGDGYTDDVEAGSDPTMPADTDGDGTPDHLDYDSDGDGLPDIDELTYGTDRIDTDSDGDTISDGHEWINDTDGDGTVDALDTDSDGDGFLDADEAGDADPTTLPIDTDSDGAPDFQDLDSDQDGLPDASEVDCPALGKHGRVFADTDLDSYSDLAEVSVGSDPCNAAEGVTDVGVDFFFVLPYEDPEQTDVLRFDPTVKQADVFFDVDTTGSMGGEIANLKAGLATIISTTTSLVSDAGFGVGGFDDFPVSPFGSAFDGDLPFYLLQGITTSTSAATSAVNSLTTHFGDDFPEAGYEALFQVANGSGVFGAGGSFGPFTTAGRIGGARFRNGSLPIVLHITDALAHDATTPSGFPGLGIFWTADYPASYNDHSKAQALSALQGIGARVITVQTLYGAGLEEADTAITAQTREISQSTDAVVPVCAFKTGAATWRCGVNTCCAGTIASGGDCILRYTIAADGTGLTAAATDGITAIVKYTTFDVFNDTRDDGDPGTPDTSLFITRVESIAPDDTFKPPLEPERSCTPVPSPAAFGGSAYDNGFVGFAVGSSLVGVEGAKLFFTVGAQNTTVPETESPQLFEAFIDIIDDTTGAVLDTQTVIIIVPAAPN